MKKILSLVCVALMGIASATAQIKVTFNGEVVKDGDVLTHYAVEDPDEGTVGVDESGPVYLAESDCFPLKLVLNYDAEFASKGTWCTFGECSLLFGTTATKIYGVKKEGDAPQVFEAGQIDFQMLHVTFNQGEYKDYLTHTDVFVGEKRVLTFYQNFIYADPSTGIGSTTAEAGVQLVGNSLVYGFASDAPRSLKVYSVDGKLVKSVALSKLNGSVSLGGLQNGVYVYSLLENGKQAKSGKVVLK